MTLNELEYKEFGDGTVVLLLVTEVFWRANGNEIYVDGPTNNTDNDWDPKNTRCIT